MIRLGEIPEVLAFFNEIPEFEEKNKYRFTDFKQKLEAKGIILVKELDNKIVGVKMGYARNEDTYYSWLGGVLPAYRRVGVAKELAAAMENEIKLLGFSRLEMKTKNCFKAMLIFALQNDFAITGFDKSDSLNQSTIYLEKQL